MATTTVTAASRKQAERQESIDQLKSWFPRGSTVYLVLRHQSASGQTRDIAPICLTPREDGVIDRRYTAYHVATVLGWTYKPYWSGDAVRVNGSGMDMGFWLVYELARKLYDDGYALKEQWI